MDSNSGSFGEAGGRTVIRTEELPWTPWALEGLRFKLLSINRRTGMWACIIQIDPNTETDLHYHCGDAHILVLKGGYRYEMERVNTGELNVEIGSIAHSPIIDPEGAEVYIFFNGGITGADADRKPLGDYVNVDWMYQAAKANGAADHLPPPPLERANWM
jgi:hypothetical protein